MKIYQACGCHLGDCWFLASYIANLPPQNEPIKVYSQSLHPSMITGTRDAKKNLEAIFPLFDIKNKVEIVDQAEPSEIECFALNYMNMRPVKTKLSWQNNKTKKICYQFDGVYAGNVKNPKPEELKEILKGIKEYELVRLGLPMTIGQIAKELSEASVFIGSDSGISALAPSIGTPMIIFVPPNPPPWYVVVASSKNLTNVVKLVHTAPEAIFEIKNFMK